MNSSSALQNWMRRFGLRVRNFAGRKLMQSSSRHTEMASSRITLAMTVAPWLLDAKSETAGADDRHLEDLKEKSGRSSYADEPGILSRGARP